MKKAAVFVYGLAFLAAGCGDDAPFGSSLGASSPQARSGGERHALENCASILGPP